MKKLLLFVVMLILLSNSGFCVKFDLSPHLGFTIGDKLAKVLEHLKDECTQYKLKNNNVGGKYYYIESPNDKFMGHTLSGIRFIQKNAKITSIRLEFENLSDSDYEAMTTILDDNANKKYYDEQEDKYYYIYDNFTISNDTDSKALSIFKVK